MSRMFHHAPHTIQTPNLKNHYNKRNNINEQSYHNHAFILLFLTERMFLLYNAIIMHIGINIVLRAKITKQ